LLRHRVRGSMPWRACNKRQPRPRVMRGASWRCSTTIVPPNRSRRFSRISSISVVTSMKVESNATTSIRESLDHLRDGPSAETCSLGLFRTDRSRHLQKNPEVDLWTIADQVDHAVDPANDVDRPATVVGNLTWRRVHVGRMPDAVQRRIRLGNRLENSGELRTRAGDDVPIYVVAT
jgi:hypothetical protein